MIDLRSIICKFGTRSVGAHRVATGKEAAAAGLGEPIALREVAAEGDCQKLFHMGREGGSPTDARPHTTSQSLLDLGEDQLVKEWGRLQQYVFRLSKRLAQ